MIDQLFTRLAATVASFLAATLVVIAALGFLCYAAYLALLGIASPPLAALGVGVDALGVRYSDRLGWPPPRPRKTQSGTAPRCR